MNSASASRAELQHFPDKTPGAKKKRGFPAGALLLKKKPENPQLKTPSAKGSRQELLMEKSRWNQQEPVLPGERTAKVMG